MKSNMRPWGGAIALFWLFQTVAGGHAALFDDEYAFQCGATYAIVSEAYKRLGDAPKAEEYSSRFARLETEARKLFSNYEDADGLYIARMQLHIDDTLTMVESGDMYLVLDLAEICDDGYSAFKGF